MTDHVRWHAQYLADAKTKTKAEGKDGTPWATIAASLFPKCFPELAEPSLEDIDPAQFITIEKY